MSQAKSASILDSRILVPAIIAAFTKLNPRTLARNPVMFVVATVSVLTTVLFLRDLVTGAPTSAFPSRSTSGSGLPCSSPILPRRSPKAVARRRPIRCAAHAVKPRPSCFPPGAPPTTGWCPAPASRSAISCSSRRATSSPRTVKSSRALPRSTRRRSRANPRPSSANRAATARP